MAKLKLNLEAVAVETFETTAPDRREQGTVEGLQNTAPYCSPSAEIYCPTATCHDGCTADCPGYPPVTWNQTCPPTCHRGEGCESGQPTCPA